MSEENIILKNSAIELRPVSDEDLELLMAWRSHPEIYRYFVQQDGPLVWDGHFHFWKSRRDRIDFIICVKGKPRMRKVGSVNVSCLSGIPEIGVFIGEITLMGKGIGTKSVRMVLDWLRSHDYKKITAQISKDNGPSLRLFSNLGFIKCGRIHNGIVGIYEKILEVKK